MNRFFLLFKWFLISTFALVYFVFFFINITYDILYTDLNNARKLDQENPHELIENKYSKFTLSQSANPLVLPIPKEIIQEEGFYNWSNDIQIIDPDAEESQLERELVNLFGEFNNMETGKVKWIFKNDSTIHKEGYELEIKPSGIFIKYSQPNGRFYALNTLSQLHVQYKNSIPCFSIKDEPSMKIRGVMLDISRDKIPKMETLYRIIDKLSTLKYNHLELYVEGFSFDYPTFNYLWDESETPITGEEIQLLDSYCKARYIDLVPNQNGLGHMQAWLATDEYKDLAECPEGFKFLGIIDMKMTLDPNDPRSFKLVEQMTEDMLPNFNSDYFNFNLDEPLELGEGKNKEEAEEIGVGMVYLNFVKKLKTILDKHNKKMMMWGDVVSKHPEIINEIPKDITMIEWGYESFHPFAEKSQAFEESGLPFMVAPGTSSWMTFAGRTENMRGNIENAVENGLEHGAEGMLLADWGDLGHWQYLPSIYPSLVYGSAISWNPNSKDHINLPDYLGKILLRDEGNTIGKILLDLGNYNQYEEFLMPQITLTFLGYQFGIIDDVLYGQIIIKALNTFSEFVGGGNENFKEILNDRINNKQSFRYDELTEYLNNIENQLHSVSITSADSSLIKNQVLNTIRMIKVGAGLKNYIHTSSTMEVQEKIDYLKSLHQVSDTMVMEHERLWLLNNRSGGLDRSLAGLEKINIEIQTKIETLESSSLSRFIDRQKGKAMAVGAYYILKVI